MDRSAEYDALAALFEYPDGEYARRVQHCLATVRDSAPEATALLETFSESIRALTTESAQELFTQSFDLNPACVLDLGWHLFGEQYERGEFLVKVRGLLRREGIEESHELPDHLTHVLRLLGRMQPEEAEEFAAACLLPALDKAIAGFAETENPFALLMRAAIARLESEYERCAEATAVQPALRIWDGKGVR
jgi:nitrate reductase delta subunit